MEKSAGDGAQHSLSREGFGPQCNGRRGRVILRAAAPSAVLKKKPSLLQVEDRLHVHASLGRRGMVRIYVEITQLRDGGGLAYRSDRRHGDK